MLDVAIVGGGLCGLAAANGLRGQGRSCVVFEARDRLGGRILSVPTGAGLAADLGPGWFWPATQPRMTRLIAELGLAHFAQHDTGAVLHLRDADKRPEVVGEEPVHGGARRLVGGMAELAASLARGLAPDGVRLRHVLLAVHDRGDHVSLDFGTADGPVTLAARRVVLALPPRLVDETVRFEPALDADIHDALRGTATWMAARAKVVVAFDHALWREAGRSGNAYVSHEQAVLGEVFDACGPDGNPAALGGFLALTPDLREAFSVGLALLMDSQLGQLFGAEMQDGRQSYQDWATEPLTCSRRDRDTPAVEHPDAGNPLLRRALWDGRLLWGGSETAASGAGYLEGALEAAARIEAAVRQQWSGVAMEQAMAAGDTASVNEASLARLRDWVQGRGEAAFDLYRQRLNRALAEQERDQLTQRAILGAAEEVFGQALAFIETQAFDMRFTSVERGRVSLMPALQAPFGPFLKTLMQDVVAFNRTSCALSNFPDEHHLSQDYSQTILRDLAAAWQEFSRAANGRLLAKVRSDVARPLPERGLAVGTA